MQLAPESKIRLTSITWLIYIGIDRKAIVRLIDIILIMGKDKRQYSLGGIKLAQIDADS